MATIFDKDPSDRPAAPPYARERIEQEIAHLKKPQSTRHAADERRSLGIFVSFLIVSAIVGLYVMDPFLYSWYKGDAIKAYLYLHNYDDDQKARNIAATGILTDSDVEILNHRQGSFQDYYTTRQDAEKDANSVISFMNGLSKLRGGRYDDLDPLSKVRYNLFCRWHLIPPTEWPALNPQIKDE